MQVVYHLGVHCTDEGRIFDTLARNRGIIEQFGVLLPHPNRFRPVIQDTVRSLNGANAPENVQEMVLDAIIEQDEPKRIILSYPSFMGSVKIALGEDRFYPKAADRTSRLRRLFHRSEVEFFVGICNPATFLPAVFAKLAAEDFEAYIAQTDPMRLAWSDLILRLQAANPECPITVWSNEDTPLIWPELIHAFAGLDADVPMRGLHRFVASLLTEEGRVRLKTYLAAHPPASVAQRRRVEGAFLERFGKEDEMVDEFDHPVWTPDVVERLTELYEADLFRIERMPGVTLMTP